MLFTVYKLYFSDIDYLMGMFLKTKFLLKKLSNLWYYLLLKRQLVIPVTC